MKIIRNFISLRYNGYSLKQDVYSIYVATETVRCMATMSTSDVGNSKVSEIELETSNSTYDASVDTQIFLIN